MNDILIFALIVICGLIPFGFGILYFLYRGTIVFTAASIVFVASMFVGIVAFSVSDIGFNSLYWAIPLCLVGLVSVNSVFKKKIQRPIKALNENLLKISEGVIDVNIQEKTLGLNNEIGMVGRSLSTTLEGLHNTSNFATEISKGNINAAYNLLSDDDEIGLALIEMQKSLTEAAELEKNRKVEEEHTSYYTNGVAKFSDLLRMNTNDVNELVSRFIRELVEYVGAAQGGVFVLNEENEDDVYFELGGAVAYDREKHFDKKIYTGEGLIGRCIYEKLPIFLTEVPEDYANIRSGLGDANPRCIVLIPAIVDDKVYAVIEMASFKVVEKHVISFIEKIGENVASVIANVRNNERTYKLLEESRQYSEEMASQGEELRQNIEELQATQEEMKRKERQLHEISVKLEEQEEIIKQQIEQLKEGN